VNLRYGNLQKYQNPNPIQQALINRFLAAISQQVSATNANSILDAGCGEGFATEYVRSQHPNRRFFGLDLDEAALACGRSWHPRIVGNRGDVFHLPFADNSFDLVLCLQVLEHLSEPGQALRELCRVSKCFCLLSVPHEPWFRLANFLRGKNLSCWGNDPEHIQNWSRGSFLRFVQPYIDVVDAEGSFPWFIVLGEIKT
jgi:SAM-dependent methyltransferase